MPPKAPKRTPQSPGPRLAELVRCAALVRRVCLGIDPVHTFASTGPGERICPRCRARIDARRIGASMAHAIATPEWWD